jgi:hypothetical protein
MHGSVNAANQPSCSTLSGDTGHQGNCAYLRFPNAYASRGKPKLARLALGEFLFIGAANNDSPSMNCR